MLPFPRLIEYGNAVLHWYDGALIAYDSTLIRTTNTFTDFKNNNMVLTTNNSSVLPSKGSEVFKYGTGIIIPGGINDSSTGNGNASIGTSSVLNSVINSSWAVDFWVKVSTLQNNNGFNLFPITHYPSVAWNTYSTRVAIGCYNNAYSIWNNSGGALASISGVMNNLGSSTFQHFAMQYDSTNHTITCFLNGVIWGSINFTINYNTGSTGFLRIMGSNNATYNGIIERYRFRTGLPFISSGFSLSTLYPDGS
jgi:hypothetical protein